MKTNLDKLFKVNSTFADEGVDFAIDDKTSFRLRYLSTTNPRVKAAFARHYKPYARQVELGTLDRAKEDEIMINIFCDICLVSWTGVEVDGETLEFSKENAINLFKGLPILFDTLWRYANDHSNYKEEEEKELGNS